MTDASLTTYPTNITNLTDLQLLTPVRTAKSSTAQPVLTQQIVATPVYQPPPQPVAPVQVPPPLPPNSPRHPLPVVSQALHSTYPSRPRTGTTLLVQPILTQPSAAAGNTRASTRRGSMISQAQETSSQMLVLSNLMTLILSVVEA
ncbi:uncharacterized protein F5147DRAFT_709758 [Suillus discolor]|uniref:Uncharacterized protein n=1 Tax=Suillus discolor TaxID=1912936 RepID=A0A9P7JR78_9AGAM|nr:uncharacterized protein F5147DRAFT_709758 [Suillus discolor]KAG2101090.1 hypothetical protein F5147DRAFT_709758 [Suillus discolor]